MVVTETEFPALSWLEWLVVCLLTYGEVPVTSPVSIVVIVAVNSVCSRPHLWLREHELVVSSLVLERLRLESVLVCHYLVRDIERWRNWTTARGSMVRAPFCHNCTFRALRPPLWRFACRFGAQWNIRSRLFLFEVNLFLLLCRYTFLQDAFLWDNNLAFNWLELVDIVFLNYLSLSLTQRIVFFLNFLLIFWGLSRKRAI